MCVCGTIGKYYLGNYLVVYYNRLLVVYLMYNVIGTMYLRYIVVTIV